EGETTDVVDTGNKLVLLWPHTYMNASGRSVRKALEFYKLTPADLLVVCDDLNLPSGRLRIRPKGSAGGQKGLADIIRLLNTEEFARLRVGIDRPPDGWKVTDYVLGRFSVDESGSVDQACDHAVRTILDWCQNDMQTVMSRHNGFSATA
ncbi:MAG: aminoacyl-tRNA hydrolase, partial [Planctomycetota bacterium]